MRDTTLKIALAGLMHDIGKFSQGCLAVSRDYLEGNAGLYQPFDKKSGRHTHVHAVYTAAFIEQMAESLPAELNKAKWAKGDSFVNLAAGHHNPNSPMQWIVAVADRISSGLDRATFERGEKIAYQDFKRTRLLPVLESLGPERNKKFDSSDMFQYEYPLAPLSAENIFPVKKHEHTKEDAQKEYEILFKGFKTALPKLPHKSNIDLWAQHFDSLLMVYTSSIPAARVGDVVHDVSLYDHCRTTAAIASALYGYHEKTATLDERSICDHEDEKFLLIGGDFYGIQDFIFSMHGESRKYRSKLLRGRSFAISLFSELAARLICERLGLPFLSVILNAAGKFHILAPNHEDIINSLRECEAEINDWLFDKTYGESSIGISWTKARPSEFLAGNFRGLWDRHLQGVEERKYHKVDLERHGGVVSAYLDSFTNDIEAGKRLCPLCGKRPSSVSTKGDPVYAADATISCPLCRDHVYFGGALVKSRYVAICRMNSSLSDKKRLLEPIFSEFQVSFVNNSADNLAKEGDLLALWQISINEDGTVPVTGTLKFINGHVPWFREEDNYDDCLLESAKGDGKLDEMISQIRDGAIKTFGHIAIKARHSDGTNGKCKGIEALGVLKADVDNLGMLFGCGLERDRFTISRLSTISRQLNNFFALYLPHRLAQDERSFDVYTVFAGGDDLFLIGPWNRMAELAVELRERFKEFVCENPEITFSAGITVHKPNVPVDTLAEQAEDALKQSKRAGKNRVTMFGETVEWDGFKALLEMRSDMATWLKENFISDVMFYKLNHFVDMAVEEENLSKKETISMDELSCFKWPALFRYSLARNITKDKEKRERAMDDVGRAASWIKTYRGGMRIPLWHVLYEKRQ